jgi:hypothetical protein
MEMQEGFFIHKASEYLKAIEAVTTNMLAPYPDINAYLIQQREIISIRLGVEDLFSEYEKGGIFLNQCLESDRLFPMLWQKGELLQTYKGILTSFLQHLQLNQKNGNYPFHKVRGTGGTQQQSGIWPNIS